MGSEFIKYIATPETLKHMDRYMAKDLGQEEKKYADVNNSFNKFLFYNVQKTKIAQDLNTTAQELAVSSEQTTTSQNHVDTSSTSSNKLLFYNVKKNVVPNLPSTKTIMDLATNLETSNNQDGQLITLIVDEHNATLSSEREKHAILQSALRKITVDWENKNGNYTLKYYVTVN